MIFSQIEPEEHVKHWEVTEFSDYFGEIVILSASDSLTFHGIPIQTVLTDESDLDRVHFLLLLDAQPAEVVPKNPNSEVRIAANQ